MSAQTPSSARQYTQLTGFKRDLLWTLYLSDEENIHGLAIKSALEEIYGEEINHGRLYPNLDDLVDHGLINKGELDRRTNYYELTAKGKSLLADRQSWERGA